MNAGNPSRAEIIPYEIEGLMRHIVESYSHRLTEKTIRDIHTFLDRGLDADQKENYVQIHPYSVLQLRDYLLHEGSIFPYTSLDLPVQATLKRIGVVLDTAGNLSLYESEARKNKENSLSLFHRIGTLRSIILEIFYKSIEVGTRFRFSLQEQKEVHDKIDQLKFSELEELAKSMIISFKEFEEKLFFIFYPDFSDIYLSAIVGYLHLFSQTYEAEQEFDLSF